jgi:hypothetical protein
LLQFKKKWEDSTILLVSNKPQQQGQEKKTKTDHLKDEKLLTTTKPQKIIKLNIDNL